MFNTAYKLPATKRLIRKVGRPSTEKRLRANYQALLNDLGWSTIPNALLLKIANDLSVWQKSVSENSDAQDVVIFERNARVRYWVKAYLANLCSLKTALQALS
jgi:hypothetical protein